MTQTTDTDSDFMTPVDACTEEFANAKVLLIEHMDNMKWIMSLPFEKNGNTNISFVENVSAAVIALDILEYDFLLCAGQPDLDVLIDFLAQYSGAKRLNVMLFDPTESILKSAANIDGNVCFDFFYSEDNAPVPFFERIKAIAAGE